MGYPMKKELKIKLVFMYYELMCECPALTSVDYR
jgi:hypothetical protein